MVIFLDTYAIIEIDAANPNYSDYIKEQAITTIFNLLEVHFYYLKKFGQKEAAEIFDYIAPLAVYVDSSILKEANKFKLVHLKKRFSFADCIGYQTALMYNAKFVTGDYLFKDFDNVEFVK